MGRERRRRTRRTGAAPRPMVAPSSDPNSPGDTTGVEAPSEAGSPARPVRAARPVVTHVRSDRVLARESAQMMSESKRVLAISAVCFGMLAGLVIVDRLT